MDQAEEQLLEQLVRVALEAKPAVQKNCASGLTKEVFLCLSNSLMYEPTHDGYIATEPPEEL